MARGVLAGVVIAAALGVVGRAGAGQLPILRAARVVHHHVVLEISVGDVRPVELTVAKRRAVDVHGALLQKNVRLQETIRLPASASGVVRWQSPEALRAGVYFVQVTAVDTGGVTDCPPKTTKCGEDFSNVRRVVVRKPS
jgi:hypothetical protein